MWGLELGVLEFGSGVYAGFPSILGAVSFDPLSKASAQSLGPLGSQHDYD